MKKDAVSKSGRKTQTPRPPQPPLPFSEAELASWRDWLITESRLPRERRLDPAALNRDTVRALQIIFYLLSLCPRDIEKHTRISHQHQRKLHLAAAGQHDLHLSLHTLSSITSGLRINLCRLLQHLMERMTAPIIFLFGQV